MPPAFFEQSAQPLVLIVDDDSDLCEALSLYLVRAGFAVGCATTTKVAERYMAISAPKVVLLDYLVPNPTFSAAFIEKVRREDGPQFVLMTCLNAAETAKKLGVHFFLQKPFDPVDVVRIVNSIVKKAYPD
jgi:DNA-binding response OmpR family regulator